MSGSSRTPGSRWSRRSRSGSASRSWLGVWCDCADRPGAANVGRKVMAVLFAMVLGADSHR